MNNAYLPALAALAGSAIGGLMSFASAWLTLHHQDRAKRLSGEKTRRQKLYKQFIDEASKLYRDALVHDHAEVSALVSVYALISRMLLIIDTYFKPNKTFPEIRELMNRHAANPLRAFSEECRAELQALTDR